MKRFLPMLLLVLIAGLTIPGLCAKFSVVVLPDTQYYSESYPDIFIAQTQWIKNNYKKSNIVFVAHVGDVVNVPTSDKQWLNAKKAMNILHGVVPYGIAPGNHDVMEIPLENYGKNYLIYFGPAYFEKFKWYGGSSPTGLSSYQLIQAGGMTLLFLNLTFEAKDDELKWAQEIITAHEDKPIIVSTHNYLNNNGGKGAGTYLPGYNSGVGIWEKLIKKNRNIIMVLCGHVFPGDCTQTSMNDAGKPVYELLSDYQGLANGGNGWLRIMTFDTSKHIVDVKTYSPYLKEYMTDKRNEFVLELNIKKRIAKD